MYDWVTLKTSAKKAQAIIVSSKFEYEDALEFGISKDKIRIIPMGVKVDKTIKEKAANNTLQLLFVGRIARVRHLELGHFRGAVKQQAGFDCTFDGTNLLQFHEIVSIHGQNIIKTKKI